MHFECVIVHSVDKLDEYHKHLLKKKEELETLLKELEAGCRQQNDNWNDPQYRKFEQELKAFTQEANRNVEKFQTGAIDLVDAVLTQLKR